MSLSLQLDPIQRPGLMARDTVSRVIDGLEALRSLESMKGDRLRTPVVRRLSQSLFGDVRKLGKARILETCGRLLETRDTEARLIAFDWAFRCRRAFTVEDFETFERWVGEYVSGWGSCDDLCTHVLGAHVLAFPEVRERLRGWTDSETRWVRRAAAVALIYSVRRESPGPAYEIADLLLADPDDLVQKGYGWLLREVSRFDPEGVFEFVMNRRGAMPRTAFRYAIEKLEPELHRVAMAKN